MEKKASDYESELTEQFKGLTKEQQILLFYRNLIDRRKFYTFLDKNKIDNTDEILQMLYHDDIEYIIAFANKVGLIEAMKALLLYIYDDTKSSVKKLYADSLIHYQHVLENYQQLGQALKLDDALQLSHLFSYLLWNGYLSVTKQHSYQLQDRLSLPEMPFEVINGQGVCASYSEFLHSFLETCQKKSAYLNCKVPRNNLINYSPKIKRVNGSDATSERRQKIISLAFRGIVNSVGNHAVVLIEDEHKMYIYDSTNLCVLNIQDKNTATLINGQGKYFIKPLATLLISPNADPNHLFEKILAGEESSTYGPAEIINSYEQVLDLVSSNQALLEDAYTNIHRDLEFISQQTKELGDYATCLKKIRTLKNK